MTIRIAMLVLMLAGSSLTQAAIYKCPGPNGNVQFSNQPCNGAAASPENEIQVKTYEVGGRLATDEQVKLQEKRRADISAKRYLIKSGDSEARYSDNLQPGTNKPAVVFSSGDGDK